MSISTKRPPRVEVEKRAFQQVYDDINQLVAAVNADEATESRATESGNKGDVRLVKNGSTGKYYIEGKFSDGWAQREMFFSKASASDTSDEDIGTANVSDLSVNGSATFKVQPKQDSGVSTTPADDNTLTVKAYVDGLTGSNVQINSASDTNIQNPAGGHILIYDGTDTWDNKVLTGDITITAAGLTTIADGVVTGAMIDGATITASNIVTGTITADQIQNATITGTDIANATIAAANIGNNVITAGQIANNTITATQIGNNVITADEIANNTITATQIGNNVITADQIASNTITAGQIGNNVITADQIASNTITAAEIGTNAVTADEIANNTIVAGNIASNTITAAEIGTNAITADEIASNTIVAGNIASNTITAGEIGENAITANEIASNTIVAGNMGTNSISSGSIQSSAVTSGKIEDGAVTAGKIGDLSITAGMIANLTITSANIGNLVINNEKIATNTIDGADKIALNSITAAVVAAGTITADKIAVNTLTAAQIAAGTITASEITVSSLSSLTANIGSVTAGDINIGSGKFILGSNGDATFSDGRFFFHNTGDMYIKPSAADSTANTRRGLIFTEPLDGSGDWTDYWMQYHDEDDNNFNFLYNGGNKFLISSDGTLTTAGTEFEIGNTTFRMKSSTSATGMYVDWYSTDTTVTNDHVLGGIRVYVSDTHSPGFNGTMKCITVGTAGLVKWQWRAGNASTGRWWSFDEDGESHNPLGGTTWDTYSDERVKENITDIPDALLKLDGLRPVTFNYTDAYVSESELPSTKKWGFVAQEFKDVIPEGVSEKVHYDYDDFHVLNTDMLVPLLVKAVKELKAEIEVLKGN